MKVMRLEESAPGRILVEANVPKPEPGPDEWLIRVHAAGVIPAELEWYPTSHGKTGEKRARAIPGHEFSGVIAGSGNGDGSFDAGKEVFGMNDWYVDGAMAEYCVAPRAAVAPKPASLTHVEAASIPISGLTAWQGLFDHARLQPGERVLVHGGAGAVGMFAIQLASQFGARVITTVSARDFEFAKALGAETVIDYHSSRFEDHARDVDVVFDTVGGEVLARSWAVLKPGGRLVTVASNAEGKADDRAKKAFFIVEPNRKQLIEIGDRIETGRLHTVVDSVLPLSKAAEFYTGQAKRQGRGKLVVEIAA